MSRRIGAALVAEWDGLRDEQKTLPMHRAFLSAMSRAIGQFLAAICIGGPRPATPADINAMFTAIGDITRQTLRDELARAQDIGLTADNPKAQGPKTRALLCPEPPGVH